MILKIQTDKQIEDSSGWMTYDEIEWVEKYPVGTDLDAKQIMPIFVVAASPEELKKLSCSKDWTTTLQITRKGKNGSEFVVFNTWGYLLNNEGKTIEKL